MTTAVDIAGLVIWTTAFAWLFGVPSDASVAITASSVMGYTFRWFVERRRSTP